MKRRRSQYTLVTLVEAGSAGLWAVVAPLIGDQRDLVALARTCRTMYEHVRLTPKCTVYVRKHMVRKHMVRNAGTVVLTVPVALTDLVCTFARMTQPDRPPAWCGSRGRPRVVLFALLGHTGSW